MREYGKQNHTKEKNKLYEEQESYRAEEDQLHDPAAQYAYRRQGEYTVDDYYALPDEQRVELIDGVIYDMAAPGFGHQTVALHITKQLDEFIDSRGDSCLPFMSPVDVQLDCDERTMVQPDVVVLCDTNKLKKRCIYGAPDLVMEVLSPSTKRKDETTKLEKYRKAGVREYWMIDFRQERVVVYDFEHKSHPAIYGMNQSIPVQIFQGDCQIRFEKILEKVHKLQTYGAS
ncbi:MAG: Uma2 family endonuclease [Lachnospiraceae bacterium]|nr:Uma2 family endonuclease [Lachnospiraceae bacterium]